MGDLVELRSGLPTAVGPAPFAATADALDFAFDALSEFPTVPSPGSGATSLLAQAVDGLAGVATESGMLVVDPDRFDLSSARDEAAAVGLGPAFEPFRAFLERARTHRRSDPDFVGVRVPLLGPVTLALALRAAGLPLDGASGLAGALVARRAELLLGAVRKALKDETVLVCLSEPGLVGGMHPTFPLAPAEVLALLDPAIDRLDRHRRAGRLLIGAHVPGRADWETIIASGVSVLSVPATSDLAGWAPALGGFLDRGGRVAWGAVPVDQPLGSSEELLWRRLSGVWCELVGEGLDPLVLRSRSLVSPVDGLGHFGPSQATLAMGLVASISTRVGRQAVAARLSLGA